MQPHDATSSHATPAPDASAVALDESEREVARVMRICNACRYCEGFCAVFPAMTRRLEFGKADVHYLANLCHDCGACLHACQYAAPHEFAVHVPPAMARVRMTTYAQYAWPSGFATLYRRNGLATGLALAAGLALLVMLAGAPVVSLGNGAAVGDFYAVYSHSLMLTLFGMAFAYALLALVIGARHFWRDVETRSASWPASSAAVHDVLTLKYLDGGHGEGCNDRDDRFTLWRRRWHHVTFYGFVLCFASTVAGTVYHYVLDRVAPYALTSVPVVLGTLGGMGLIVGPCGLLWLAAHRHAHHRQPEQKPMDYGFIALLLLSSASGLALLAWRDTFAMAPLLAAHLGVVLALFVTLPYGKFAHAVYRCAALLKFAMEKQRASSRLNS